MNTLAAVGSKPQSFEQSGRHRSSGVLVVGGGDRVSVGLGTLRCEVETIPEVLGVTVAGGVPVHQHCLVRVATHPIGVEPNAGFLPPSIRRDDSGRVITDERMRTAEPAIFAIGALRSGFSGELTGATSRGSRTGLWIAGPSP